MKSQPTSMNMNLELLKLDHLSHHTQFLAKTSRYMNYLSKLVETVHFPLFFSEEFVYNKRLFK